MNRSLFNLLAVSAILIFITTACFYTSSRETQKNSAPANQANATENSEPKKSFSTNRQDKGDFTIEHIAVNNPRYVEIDKQVKDEKLLEKAADKLNRSLKLPYDINLRTKDCGEVNAFYNSDDHSVTVCYELMEHFYKVFRSGGFDEQNAYDKMFDAVRFAFLHEIGHALIDTYDLPITGSEEDAADRCSSFINLTELGEDGINAVFAAADAFNIESRNGSSNKSNLADEHLLQEQRFYNSLCMIYGSNRTKYAYIVEDKYLPSERAQKCPQEYERMAQSWSILLAPWRKD